MAASGPVLPGRPSEQRPRARHRGLFWLAAMISALALVAGSYIAVSSYLSSAEPGDVAIAYFAAVAKGDAARALSYGPVPAADRDYLTAEVLKAQLAVGAISDAQVLSVAAGSGSEDTARVNVTYRLSASGGSSRMVTDVVPMIRRNRHWWLAQSAVSTKVGLHQALERATFAGTSFPSGTVLLFPGALPITFDTPNLELGDADSTVQFSIPDNSGLTVEASADGIGAARSAVGAALQACLGGTSPDAFCPTPGNGSNVLRAVPDSLRGSLAPGALNGLTVTVTLDPHGVLAVAGTVAVNGNYLALNYANVATPASDQAISLAVAAQSYASSVATVTWKTP